jgi:hypothetical protein
MRLFPARGCTGSRRRGEQGRRCEEKAIPLKQRKINDGVVGLFVDLSFCRTTPVSMRERIDADGTAHFEKCKQLLEYPKFTFTL